MTEKRPYPLHQGIAEVRAVADVTPVMRRITFHAPEFGTDFGVQYPGELLSLGWPVDDGGFDLPSGRGVRRVGWIARMTVGRSHWRNFTIRAHDRAAATVDIDFFLHGDAGRGARWALDAETGQKLAFAGPRVHFQRDERAEWTVLVADETGLPAVQSIVESLPAGHPVTAVVEVADAGEESPVAADARVDWRWLHRGDRAPGTTSGLSDAIAALALPTGPGQVWGGAESRAMRAVREAVKSHEPEPTKQLIGYWKRKD